jgi:oxygen-dependent protoporphyrinogen oxidase
MRESAVVIGGGLAGLVAAWRLRASGRSVLVLESQAEVGGWAQSWSRDGFGLERGPHTFRGQSPGLHALVKDLDLELCSPGDAGVRWISRGGLPYRLPSSPLGMLWSPVLSLRGRIRLMTEPFRRRGSDPNESVQDFFTRRLGPEAAQILVGSMVGGIHATDPSRLGIADSFPRVWAWEQEFGSLFRGAMAAGRARKGQPQGLFAPRDGMGEISRVLAEILGDSVQRDSEVLSLERTGSRWQIQLAGRVIETEQLVLATPAHVTASLLQTLRPEASRILEQVESSGVVVVHRYGRSGGQELPAGFGMLIAPDHPRSTLGILFSSRQFPHRLPGPDAWCLASFHPLGDEEERSRGAWAELAAEQASSLLDFHQAAVGAEVQIMPRAIPVLRPGHLARMQKVQECLPVVDGLVLAGSYLRGVSLECAVESGEQAARALMKTESITKEVA